MEHGAAETSGELVVGDEILQIDDTPIIGNDVHDGLVAALLRSLAFSPPSLRLCHSYSRSLSPFSLLRLLPMSSVALSQAFLCSTHTSQIRCITTIICNFERMNPFNLLLGRSLQRHARNSGTVKTLSDAISNASGYRSQHLICGFRRIVTMIRMSLKFGTTLIQGVFISLL